MIYIFCIPESPKFLINSGRLEEAEWALTKVARVNNAPDFVFDPSMFGKDKHDLIPCAFNIVVQRDNGRRIDGEIMGSVKAYA